MVDYDAAIGGVVEDCATTILYVCFFFPESAGKATTDR